MDICIEIAFLIAELRSGVRPSASWICIRVEGFASLAFSPPRSVRPFRPPVSQVPVRHLRLSQPQGRLGQAFLFASAIYRPAAGTVLRTLLACGQNASHYVGLRPRRLRLHSFYLCRCFAPGLPSASADAAHRILLVAIARPTRWKWDAAHPSFQLGCTRSSLVLTCFSTRPSFASLSRSSLLQHCSSSLESSFVGLSSPLGLKPSLLTSFGGAKAPPHSASS